MDSRIFFVVDLRITAHGGVDPTVGPAAETWGVGRLGSMDEATPRAFWATTSSGKAQLAVPRGHRWAAQAQWRRQTGRGRSLPFTGWMLESDTSRKRWFNKRWVHRKDTCRRPPGARV